MLPSIERLRDLFDYDPETGVLTRKMRPREDFATSRAWRIHQARYTAEPAGWPDDKGYVRVKVDKDGNFLAHRVIWALAYGSWPVLGLDHRDGDPSNNRLSNLREATKSENAQNQKPVRSTGVFFDAATRGLKRRFRANIGVNGKQIGLGSFSTHEEAHAAYLAAKARLHTFQPVPRE